MENSESKFNKTHNDNKQSINELNLLKGEQEIARALNAQRLFGHLIIRDENEEQLLKSICKAAVEEIGYKLCWIGFAMEDKSVKPVASAGLSKDYLEKIRISWSDNEFSQGPTGQAIKTGESIVMNDIINNPKFLPWRESAIRKGFKSSVAIPLLYDKKVFGAFNLYSSEKDVFNEEELSILQLAANDLAIGISNIRRKKEIQLKSIELQKAKGKAEENEEKYKTIFNQAPLGIALINSHTGIISEVNSKFAEITGRTIDEVINTDWMSITHPDDIQEDLDNMAQMNAGKISGFQMEKRYMKPDGSYVWIHMTIAPVNDEHTVEKRHLAMIEDITDRKQHEVDIKHKNEELMQSNVELLLAEETFRTFTESSKAAVFVIKDRKFWYGNKACEEILERKSEELKEMTFEEVLHPDSLKLVSENHKKRLEGKNVDPRYDVKMISKSGKVKDVEINVAVINLEGSAAVLVSAFDITERKRAEQLQKVLYNISNAVITKGNLIKLIGFIQKELGTIIDSVNLYVTLYDPLTDTLSMPYIIDEKNNFSTLPAEKTLTKYVIKTKKSLLAGKEKLKVLEEAGEIERFSYNTKIWIGVPLKIKDEVIGVLTVRSNTDENAYDNSDLKLLEFVSDQISTSIRHKKAEEDLILALSKAKESDRLKSAFLANMSHEIRTPMNGILGFSSLLKIPDLTEDKQQKYIEIIEKSGVRMLNTINDLMDISKIEAGQMDVYISEVNINELIEELYNFFKPEAEKKGLLFSVENVLSVQEVIIKSDREKIYAILANLVKNAIKYTHEGSIEFGCSKKGNKLEFFVKDTGIGIPNNRQQAIFDRFVQADIEDREVYEGSGLGLSISKAYVEMLGGEIKAESKVENLPAAKIRGSEFYFTIPCNVETEEKTSTKASFSEDMDESQKTELKTLIVDDEETARIYLGVLMESLSKEIMYATNGFEAVELCRRNPDIDLILMDVKMPKIDGYEATKQIRKFNKDVIIIAQTAFALLGDMEKALVVGCNDYISKPIKKDELIGIIKSYFNN